MVRRVNGNIVGRSRLDRGGAPPTVNVKNLLSERLWRKLGREENADERVLVTKHVMPLRPRLKIDSVIPRLALLTSQRTGF